MVAEVQQFSSRVGPVLGPPCIFFGSFVSVEKECLER